MANTLDGGPGDDLLDGAGGADVLEGGAGLDTADYSARTAAVTVDNDGVNDDGASNERDDVRPSVERVLGAARATRSPPRSSPATAATTA